MRTRAARRLPWWIRPHCTRGMKVEPELRSAYELGRRAGRQEGVREATADAQMWLNVGRRLAADPDGTRAILRRVVEDLDGDDGEAVP